MVLYTSKTLLFSDNYAFCFAFLTLKRVIVILKPN